MRQNDLPNELLQFIENYIDSVEQILVLQTLFDNPQRVWTVSELTNEIRSARTSIDKRLMDFYQKKVLLPPKDQGDGVTFSPADAKMENAIHLLIDTFRERPSRVVAFIYSRPSKSIQAFSDAFKFGREEE